MSLPYQFDRGALLLASCAASFVLCDCISHAQVLSWTRLTPPTIPFRNSPSMAYDSRRGVIVMYGGYFGTHDLSETREWNGTAWILAAGGSPSSRDSSAMAFDMDRGRTVLFGGWIDAEIRPDDQTWEWNGSVWRQRAVQGPSARQTHSMAFDSQRHVVVLFGGIAGGVPSGETWEWDGSAWIQRSIQGPSPRGSAAMVYDSDRNVMVLFGGTAFSGTSSLWGDTWEWNGTTWHLRQVLGPSARAAHSMAYDPIRHVTVLFGGWGGGDIRLGDTWEWDGTAWTQRPITGPSPRSSHAMAYDTARRKIILFGGYGTTTLGDTWELVSYCPSDLDDGSGTGRRDGGSTIDDLLFFLTIYAATDPRADLDNGTFTGTPDGGVTTDDLLYYLTQYAAGC